MEPVAVINKVPVFSDKVVLQIDPPEIRFTDGSWANVESNQTFNAGAGFLSIGTPPEEPEDKKKKREIEKFDGVDMLDITGLRLVSLTVEVHDRDHVEVQKLCTEVGAERLLIKQLGTTLHIGKKAARRNNTIISNGDIHIGGKISGINTIIGSTVVTYGNQKNTFNSDDSVFFSNKGELEADVELRILVPRGTNLTLSNVEGDIVVGDIEGDVVIDLDNSQSARIGKVKNADLTAETSAVIMVQHVEGQSLEISADTSAVVVVNGGDVNSLKINVDTSAKVQFEGRAHHARLKADTNGTIHVASVEQVLRRSADTLGKIDIDQIG